MARILHCAPHHDPRPGFWVILPFVPSCGSFLQANWSACSLEHTVFVFYYCALAPCHSPRLDYHPSIIACQNPMHLQREEKPMLTKYFVGHALSRIILLNLYHPHSVSDRLAPCYRWGRFRKITCLKLHSWKVAKSGFGICNPGPSWHRSSWPIHHLLQAAC